MSVSAEAIDCKIAAVERKDRIQMERRTASGQRSPQKTERHFQSQPVGNRRLKLASYRTPNSPCN